MIIKMLLLTDSCLIPLLLVMFITGNLSFRYSLGIKKKKMILINSQIYFLANDYILSTDHIQR